MFSLAYADDVVLLAEEKEEMRSMIGRFEEYLERKGLELNAGKTKMRFRKEKGRMEKRVWRWKGKRIEEVKEFKYLGYVRVRVKEVAAVMGQVWGIGKRRYGSDWGKRLWLFDQLVWTVAGYGVEIWEWEEKERVEEIEERYLRWMLGVDRKTPSYMIREELQREKLKGRAGRRAWNFEERLKEARGDELARRCWEEIRERGKERRNPNGKRKERDFLRKEG